MKAEYKKPEDEFKYLYLFADQLVDSIVITDSNFKISYVNSATEELYGYLQKELLGKMPELLNAEPLSEQIQKIIYKNMAAGKVWRGTHLNRRKDGSVFFCEHKISPFRDKKKKLLCYIGIHRDVMEQKRFEKTLHEVESRYYTLFENVPVGVGLATDQGRVLAFNKKMTLFTGYSESELERVNVKDMYVDLKDYESVSRELQTKGAVSDFEVELKKKNGEIYYGNLSITLFKIGEKKVKLTVLKEITERKKAEAELNRYRMNLEKIVEERTAEIKAREKVLEEKNITLREILSQLEIEKKSMQDNIVCNINNLVLPVVRKLKNKVCDFDKKHFEVLEDDLDKITSSFGKTLIRRKLKLTPREIEISDMIRAGFTTKEIAGSLNISPGTVSRHRENIRKKLNLSGKTINLSTFLTDL